MIEIKNILVPTDFSENAESAYPYAKRLAEEFGATVTVVHVADLTTYQVGPEETPIAWEGFAGELQAYNETEMEKVLAEFGDVAVKAVMLQGAPFVEIVKLARTEAADLIVISTHGRTGIKHLIMGSTAERVVRKAPCPVLTIHPGDRSFVMP